MKLSSTSAAKLLLILSIVIATGSVWKGLEWRRATDSVTRQLRSAQAAEQQSRLRSSALAEVLPGNETPQALAQSLVALIDTLHSTQLEHRVQAGSITAPNAAGAAVTELLDLAQPIDNSALYSVTLEVRGTYREYTGLRRYLEQVFGYSAAVTYLSISGQSFEMHVRLIGAV